MKLNLRLLPSKSNQKVKPTKSLGTYGKSLGTYGMSVGYGFF